MAFERASRKDRAKAATAAILVQGLLGAAFLSGLVTNITQQPSDVLQTFDVIEPPPPPPIVEIEEEAAPKGDPGEAGKKAEPTPIVVPPPKIELPAKPPVAAAPVPGQGAAPSAGAALSGTGTGAGGIGNGLGGGDRGGNGAGFTPAQQISKIPDSEYRRIAATGIRDGAVSLMVRVNSDGTPSNCRITRSSGNSYADALLCELTVHYVRYRPALDPQGRAVAQDKGWTPRWWKVRRRLF